MSLYWEQKSGLQLPKIEENYDRTPLDTFIEKRGVTIAGLTNGSDLFIYPNIPDSIIGDVRSNFKLHIDEQILYFRDTSFWNDKNQGTVITDLGITCIPDNDSIDDIIQIDWGSIHHVEYNGQCLYFFYDDDERDNNTPFHISHFLKDESSYERYGKNLAFLFTCMAKTKVLESDEDIWERTTSEYEELIEEGKEDEALNLALRFREEQQHTGLTPQIVSLYIEKGQEEKALSILDEDISALPDNPSWRSVLTAIKYAVYENMKDIVSARRFCLETKQIATPDTVFFDKNILDEATDDFIEFENLYIQNFLDLPYQERKLVVPVKSYSDLSQKTLSVLDIRHLPAINFPMGHPVANQLYVGHPYIPSKYIPFEHYELEFIEDKVREFCQIAQYLGATEIDIECINTTTNNKDNNSNQKISGSADYKLISASANRERNQSNKFIEDISQNINLHQKFNPKGEPTLPPDLLWYPNEASWQRLYKQRMQGAIFEHEERIETKKSQVIENSQLMQIAAEVKWLFLEAKGNWEQSMDEKFEAHENAILAIHVKFAPLETLHGDNVISTQTRQMTFDKITNTEKEYLEEIKACMDESNEISPRERRLLEKLRIKLGINEYRAKELEKSLISTQLTEEEQEYLEEYKACLMDDEDISPKERRLLDKLRKSLGISEERAKEIEMS